MFTIAAGVMIFIEKFQRGVIRIFFLEVAKIIYVNSKAIGEYDCNRMRQNVVYNCVQHAK
jgi:hypothetical protein